jgi:hypothetical protein
MQRWDSLRWEESQGNVLVAVAIVWRDFQRNSNCYTGLVPGPQNVRNHLEDHEQQQLHCHKNLKPQFVFN